MTNTKEPADLHKSESQDVSNELTSELFRRFSSPLVFFIMLATVLFALTMRLLTAYIPIEQLVGICLADDAYYYFQIAENILTGNGASFDGQIETNGFHPLWLFICMGLKLLYPGEMVVRAALVVLAFIGAANTLLLFFLGRKLGGVAAGVSAAIFWAIHPFVGFIELMGVEAPLAVFAVLLCTLWWVKIKENDRAGKAAWAILGLLVALCFLARTDMIFFVFFIMIEVLVVFRHKIRTHLFRILLAGAVAAAAVLPWFAWNLIHFGRITQDSGRSIYQFVRSFDSQAGFNLLEAMKLQIPSSFQQYLLRYTGIEDYSIGLLVFVGALALGVIIGVLMRDNKIGVWRGAPAMIFAGMSTWFFYNFIFMTRKQWYFLLFLAVMALLFGRLVGFLARKTHGLQWVVVFGVFTLLAPSWFSYAQQIEITGFHGWQRAYYVVAKQIEAGQVKGIESGDILAGWNCGIYGAYSGHRVVNLDGVVNPNIYDAVAQKRFMSYIQEAGIKHVIDHEIMFNSYSRFTTKPFHDYLKLTKRYKLNTFAGDILVLTVKDKPDSPTQTNDDPEKNSDPEKPGEVTAP